MGITSLTLKEKMTLNKTKCYLVIQTASGIVRSTTEAKVYIYGSTKAMSWDTLSRGNQVKNKLGKEQKTIECCYDNVVLLVLCPKKEVEESMLELPEPRSKEMFHHDAAVSLS